RCAQQFRQDRRAGAARVLDDREVEFAAAGVADLAFIDLGDTRGAQKAVDGLLRRADPRAAPFLPAVGLLPWDAVGNNGQPARSDVALQRRRRDLGLRQLAADQPREIFDRAPLHPRRDLLRQEFEQQLAHATRLPISSCPGLSRASTSLSGAPPWMAGSSP